MKAEHTRCPAPCPATYLCNFQGLSRGAVPLGPRLLLQARLKRGLVDQQAAAAARLKGRRIVWEGDV